ncbi:MAG: hypothetical protein DMG22_00455 [Acidobacteria bacterium]|nr:MAG: hypothetical protein DMG22_00455 [Acidobacteriota bacterium]
MASFCKGAWAFFVFLQVATAGLLFLICFYLLLSVLGNLLGAPLALKEWKVSLGSALVPSAWLLIGFLSARLLGQISLDLMGKFRPMRCPACGIELAQGANPFDFEGARVCPKCGAKI